MYIYRIYIDHRTYDTLIHEINYTYIFLHIRVYIFTDIFVYIFMYIYRIYIDRSYDTNELYIHVFTHT